ncbi:MAG: NUDIX hydrolase [Thermodesulfobacteriota bacterium]
MDPGYKFCPKCASSLERRSLKPGEPPRLVCRGCGFVFYLDSKVAAGTIPVLDGKVVLLKRAIEPGYGKWVFPGGFVDRGETVEAAAVRETKEEVNLNVRPLDLLGVYSYPGRPVIVVVYRAEVIGGELRPGDEALEARVFDNQEIPWDELAFPSTRDALRDLLGR